MVTYERVGDNTLTVSATVANSYSLEQIQAQIDHIQIQLDYWVNMKAEATRLGVTVARTVEPVVEEL